LLSQVGSAKCAPTVCAASIQSSSGTASKWLGHSDSTPLSSRTYPPEVAVGLGSLDEVGAMVGDTMGAGVVAAEVGSTVGDTMGADVGSFVGADTGLLGCDGVLQII